MAGLGRPNAYSQSPGWEKDAMQGARVDLVSSEAARPKLPLCVREEAGALLRLALPLAAIQLGHQAMGAVDTAIVGRLGATEMAAAALGNSLFFAFAIIGIGIMMGLDPLISQALGANNPGRARLLLWQGFYLGALVTVLLSLPIALLPLVLEPLGIEADVSRFAGSYLHIRLLGLYPLFVFMGIRGYLQAVGLVRPLVISVILANILNLGLTWLLVFGGESLPAWTGILRRIPSLGPVGMAIGLVGATVAQLAVLWFALRRVEPGFRWRQPFDAAVVRRALRVGIPIGLHMGAEVGVFALVGFLAGTMGKVSLAAHQVALTLASLSFTAVLGIGNAASVRVGRAVGAGDTPRARLAGRLALILVTGYMAVWALLFLLAPYSLARLVTDQADVIQAAMPLFFIAALFQVADGIQGVGAGLLRGAGDTRFTFYANVFGHYAVGLPVAVFLGFTLGQGVSGLWWGFVAGLVVVSVGLVLRFQKLSANQIAPIEAHQAG